MNFFQAFILSVVQGLTEFLPVSSSGHLAVLPFFMNLGGEVPLSFDVLLHMGTLFAVFVYLRGELLKIIKGFFSLDREILILIGKIIVALIPAAIIGYLFNDKIGALFYSPKNVGFAYFGTALLLFLTVLLKSERKTSLTITYWDALIIGIFQSLALVPGFSRSGFTLFGALLVGMRRVEAFKFSFILSIPAIIGAFLFETISGSKGSFINISLGVNIFAFLISLIAGLIAMRLLYSALKNSKLYLFGFYCLILGIILVVIF
jgi:undecaprenyl-diphosphatase